MSDFCCGTQRDVQCRFCCRKATEMPKNSKLHRAKKQKNDEFYTQYQDIEREMNAYLDYDPDVFKEKTILLPCDDPEWSNFTKYFAQNFERFGLKKLISTSYAADSKPKEIPYQPTLFEINSPKFDKTKTHKHGKIFILERDINKDKKININDLEWDYLEGDGDFRSDEIAKLKDEADIIITNPPFSLFREFFFWLTKSEKKFAMIANKNCITYKEVFPLVKDNSIWSGREEWAGGMWFKTTDNAEDYDKIIDDKKYKNVPSIRITNIDHGRRHEPLSLMSMDDNLKYSKHKNDPKWAVVYRKYDNYDAIEIPFTDAIPSDYPEVMGVPISFLDKYCPEQFSIMGWSRHNNYNMDGGFWKGGMNDAAIDGKSLYRRILIKHKEQP